MTKRISKKRMEEIRAGVGEYVAKLERGEISNEVKPAGIAIRAVDGPAPSVKLEDILEPAIVLDPERIDTTKALKQILERAQPSLQPSGEKSDRDRDAKD
jgi:hypothetical protein